MRVPFHMNLVNYLPLSPLFLKSLGLRCNNRDSPVPDIRPNYIDLPKRLPHNQKRIKRTFNGGSDPARIYSAHSYYMCNTFDH